MYIFLIFIYPYFRVIFSVPFTLASRIGQSLSDRIGLVTFYGIGFFICAIGIIYLIALLTPWIVKLYKRLL